MNVRTVRYVGSWEYVEYAIAGSRHGLVFQPESWEGRYISLYRPQYYNILEQNLGFKY